MGLKWLIIALVVLVAVASAAITALLIMYFHTYAPGGPTEAPACKAAQISGTTWNIIYVNVSGVSAQPFNLREGTYTYRVIPSSGEYYEILTYTVKKINSTCFNITKIYRMYVIEGNKTTALKPSYSYYLVFTSGRSIFVSSWSPDVGTKYFNLELWPTSDNSGAIAVSPLFLPYIKLGSNWSIAARVDIYFPNQFVEYLGREKFSALPETLACSGPDGTCYVVNSELNVTMSIYNYHGEKKGSLIGVRNVSNKYRYLIDESGTVVLMEKYIGSILISKTELVEWK